MGCGRVGSTLATSLTSRGHSVAIIDQDAESFRRLGNEFEGRRVTGVGFDRDTLVMAGIEEADAFCAVSSGDNSNIIAARVARETFGVENVVARIYDPRRAQVYERLGIPTVATVRWTADQMLHRILPEGGHREWTDLSGKIVVAEVPFHHGWIGRRLRALEQAADVRVAFVTRFGEGMLPPADAVIQDGDMLHVVTTKSDIDAVSDRFALEPEES